MLIPFFTTTGLFHVDVPAGIVTVSPVEATAMTADTSAWDVLLAAIVADSAGRILDQMLNKIEVVLNLLRIKRISGRGLEELPSPHPSVVIIRKLPIA
jgi:hypothetical protein